MQLYMGKKELQQWHSSDKVQIDFRVLKIVGVSHDSCPPVAALKF